MTASLHTLGAGASAGNYYTQDPYRETQNRDDYYAKDGGGRWWTSAGSVVRDGTAIDLASFQDLCAGRDPRTGKGLVRGAGEGHRAGWDVTLTSPKTFSILWANGGSNQRAQLEAIHAEAVTVALDAALQLSAEQREAIFHVTGLEAGGVSVLEAGAGTGKTTTAKVIVEAARRAGLSVIGLAPSWTAADELAATTGIETFAIAAKWRHDLKHGRVPPRSAHTVVLCDEAGMVGTKDLAFVLKTVAAAPDSGAQAICSATGVSWRPYQAALRCGRWWTFLDATGHSRMCAAKSCPGSVPLPC